MHEDAMVQVRTERPVAGGAALAHLDDGRVALVAGALGGETVRAVVRREHRRRVELEVVEVVEAAPGRVSPPCPHVAEGCGGCDWQHVAVAAAPPMRTEIVRDALRRIGHLDDVEVVAGEAHPLEGHRTTVRLAAVGGRLGFRRVSSHEVVAIDRCLVAHPLVQEVIDGLVPGAADELTVRVGERTGDRLVLATPTASGVEAPEGVAVVGADELRGGRRVWLHEEAAGRRWRISAASFFQSGPLAAEALVGAVGRALGDPPRPSAALLDLYAGVGLFAGTVGTGWRVTAVERSPDAVADARVNLDGVRIVRADVRRFRPGRADAVVADPARAGLGREGVATVVGARAPLVVLVSCDPASLGRDAGLLAAAGYTLERVELVDAFPGTSHVEAVSRFRQAER